MTSDFEEKWLDEAVEVLGHYNTNPFTDTFLDKYNLSKTGNTRDKHKKIRDNISISKEAPTFKNLADYLDELKMYGKQHVFLYALREEQREYLDRLRDSDHVRDRLSQFGLGGLFNNSQLVWEVPELQLAEVRHFFNAHEGLLLFKWVGSRRYDVRVPAEPGQEQVLQPKTERTVNFFIVNLIDGTAEIRIQSLPSRAHRSLREELERFKKEIVKFIDFKFFSPVPLASVIKRLLGNPVLPVTGWKIEYPARRRVAGGRDPSYLFKLGLPFKNFFSREITVYWECEQEAHGRPRLFFTLNGENDEINFNSITDKLKVDFILNQLKTLSVENIEMEELRELALRYPEYSRVISTIDFHFSSLKQVRIEALEIASRVWFPEDDIHEVFNAAVEHFPRKFFIEGDEKKILGIRNRFSIKGGVLEYSKRGAEKYKRKEIIKTVITPTLSVVYIIISLFGGNVEAWIREKIFNVLLPGVPFMFFKILILLLIALVFFGSHTILRKIPKVFYSFLLTLAYGPDAEKLQNKFSGAYEKWEAERNRERPQPEPVLN